MNNSDINTTIQYSKEQEEILINELKNIIYNYKYRFIYCNIIKSKKHLMDFINYKVSKKICEEKYSLKLKLYWILNDLKDFPKCKTCGKSMDYIYSIQPRCGYPKHCSNKCAQLDIDIKEKKKQTCLKQFGVENAFQSKEKKEKIKNTLLKKYGVTHPQKSKEIKIKTENTCLKKYGKKHPSECEKVKEKQMKENIKKYGKKSFAQTEEFKKKFKETCIKKYNVEHISKLKTVKEKIKKSIFKKYGVNCVLQVKELRDKGKLTSLQRYGKEFFSQSEFFIPKKTYIYNNIRFDSKAELIYFIWLTDHNINFTYHPNITLEYIDLNEKVHYYHPDFQVNDILVEIKGDHFFDKNNNLICPFGKNNISEEEKIISNNILSKKYECMIKNNVKIIKTSEMAEYNMYVKETYGNHYLEQFKNDANGNSKSQEQNS